MIQPLKIGTLTLPNPLILAPLAGFTDLPFRLLCRRYGAALAFTEMVSATALHYDSKKTFEMLKTTPDDQPLGVQLFGSEPDRMVKAARIVEDHGAAVIDINCGCPVKKVIKQNAGAAMMSDPDRLAEMIHQMVSAVKVPVTIKIRSGRTENTINILEIAEKLKGTGLSAITLHPRTADKPYSGTPRWELLKELKAILNIPVIGSGGLMKAPDIIRMFNETGIDGAMLARGAMGHPWIFAQTLELLSGQIASPEPPVSERIALMREHLSMMVDIYGEDIACRMFRTHAHYYIEGWPRASHLRGQLNNIHQYAEFCNLTNQYLETLPTL